jgi:imidazole glycerol-phosphate synthase subunit HisH
VLVLIDIGVGNVGSMANMLARLGIPARVSGDPADVARASRLILPGVGAFDGGMQALKNKDLIPVLRDKVEGEGVPILGVCLGLHLFTEGSDEGRHEGLGWLPCRTRRFPAEAAGAPLRVPHMSWNTVTSSGPGLLLSHLPDPPRFYFAHGFYADMKDQTLVAGSTTYGISFPSVVVKNRIAGVQFHPEKSHRFGMTVLKNFAESF